ncbi:MAG: Lrp/AsnC family transcriptional regulator [Clostridiales bacterium]|nr:Lrp/AsnC family transcriptional regulator [Clostridiales bacterium]
MNDLKQHVLELLCQDCRMPVDQIAVMLGANPTDVSAAIKQMEDDRVIVQYRPVVDWNQTERTFVEAMISVKVTPQRDQGFDAVAKRIGGFEEVRSVFLMSGAYDLLVLLEAPTLKELAYFVSEKLSTLDTVTGTSTSFVLKRYKEDGVMFGEKKEDQRLVISP